MRRAFAVVVLLVAVLATFAAPSARAGTPTAPTCNGETATDWLDGPGTLVGTSGDDVLVGSDGDDLIKGGSGNDLICGMGGDDRIDGESGGDSLYGGEYSYDCLVDPDGNDVITGGPGNDLISDKCGDNTGRGDGGSDIVDVSGTADGGSGDDGHVEASDGQFTCGEANRGCVVALALGGAGHDSVWVVGGVGDGGPGNDEVLAFLPGDVARGGSGNDSLWSAQGRDGLTLDGQSGRDTCHKNGATTVTLRSCETVQS